MKTLILLMTSLFFITPSFSQVATSSIFATEKSINPATISAREYGSFSFKMAKDDIKKEKDTSSSFPGSSQTETAKIDSLNIFRGGKKGGFLTTEVGFDKSKGERDFEFDFGGSTNSSKNKFDYNLYDVGLGLGNNFGFVFSKIAMTNETDNGSGGTDKSEVDGTRMRGGFTIGFGALHLGAYHEILDVKVDDDNNPSDDVTERYLGLGLGFRTKSTHIEIAHETHIGELEEDIGDVKYTPKRTTVILEHKFSSITLGYKFQMMKEGFRDLEGLPISTTLYTDIPKDESVTNHGFNFAFGKEGGLSFSGTLVLSESKLDLANTGTNDVFPGKITHKKIGINVGYVW